LKMPKTERRRKKKKAKSKEGPINSMRFLQMFQNIFAEAFQMCHILAPLNSF